MKKFFDKHDIKYVWHFTARANLASIKAHGGLWAWALLQDKGIEVPEPGGNDLSRHLDKREVDGRKKLNGYIHLSFNRGHRVLDSIQYSEKKILDPYWLKIDLAAIDQDTVHFTEGVANTTGMELLTIEQAAQKNINWKKLTKAEILVPCHIPLKYILNMPACLVDDK